MPPRHVHWQASPGRRSGVEMGSVASYGTVDGDSTGLHPRPDSMASAAGASPGQGAPAIARHTAAMFSTAAGMATRFVLRRHNVKRQTFKDVIHSLRPGATGGASVPPSFGGPSSSGAATGLVDLESLRPAAPPTLHPEPKLGTAALLSAVISLVLASRFGCEATVGAGGPLYALIGLALLPWVWYLPTGLVVAELSTAVPSNAGVLMWTNVAYPPFVSFFCIFVTLLLNVAGLAVSGALCAAYVGRAVPSAPEFALLIVRAGAIGLGAFINCLTVDGLGAALKAITVLTAVPFVIMTLIQLLPHGLNDKAMFATPRDGVDLPVFLSYLAFTHSGLENLGSLVEDTKRPEKTMFVSIAPAMMASFLVYFLPVAAGVSALNVTDGDFSAWKPGYWGHVAGVIAGEGFERYMQWGGVVARFAALLGTVATSARLLAGMGSMNAFPTVMSNFLAMYHDTRFTPVNSIIVVSAAALPFAVLLKVNDLVAVFQALSSVRLLLCVYAPFFILRRRYPNLPRPYEFPFGFWTSLGILAPSVVFVSVVGVCASILGVAAMSISIAAIVLSVVAAALLVKYLRPDGLAGRIEQFELNEVPPSSFIEDDADDDGALPF